MLLTGNSFSFMFNHIPKSPPYDKRRHANIQIRLLLSSPSHMPGVFVPLREPIYFKHRKPVGLLSSCLFELTMFYLGSFFLKYILSLIGEKNKTHFGCYKIMDRFGSWKGYTCLIFLTFKFCKILISEKNVYMYKKLLFFTLCDLCKMGFIWKIFVKTFTFNYKLKYPKLYSVYTRPKVVIDFD